jgi:SNF2 family DNA or RNA helicase
VVFVENSWVPGEMDQAVDRCHRIGQENKVIAQVLVVKDSIDHVIMRSMFFKKRKIKEVLE